MAQLAAVPSASHDTTAAGAAGAAAAAAAAAAHATHVEWWVHRRPPWSPHQLHFDAAEGSFRHGLGAFRLQHPGLSSVLYLTGVRGGVGACVGFDGGGRIACVWVSDSSTLCLTGASSNV
jgi:hypothetical protein